MMLRRHSLQALFSVSLFAATGCKLFAPKGKPATPKEEGGPRKDYRDGAPEGPLTVTETWVHIGAPLVLTLPTAVIAGLTLGRGEIHRLDGKYVAPPGLAFRLRKGGVVVEEAAAQHSDIGGDGARLRSQLNIEDEGSYDLEVAHLGSVLSSRKLAVVQTPTIGAPHFSIVELRAPDLYWLTRPGERESKEPALRIHRWRSLDVDTPHVIEWRKNGSFHSMPEGWTLAKERMLMGTSDFHLAAARKKALPGFLYETLQLRIPEAGAGSWETIVHEQDQPSLRVSFTLGESGLPEGKSEGEGARALTHRPEVAEVATDERAREALATMLKRDGARATQTPANAYALTGQEFRALTRSQELGTLRDDLSKALQEWGGHADSVTPMSGESPRAYWDRQDAAERRWQATAKKANAVGKTEQARLWKQMQPLIAKHGGPWTDEERPELRLAKGTKG